MHAEGPKRLLLKKSGAGPVTGADIEETADVEILNPDHVICHMDEGCELRMELTVTTGKGYVPAAASRPEDAPIGLISIDALYSPVKRVAYRVEDTREGQVLDYDKLIIDVETNGAVTPEDAIAVAARILQDQFQVFVNFDDPQRFCARSKSLSCLSVRRTASRTTILFTLVTLSRSQSPKCSARRTLVVSH